ncbi:glutamate formiminotransferase/formiminotetrahydrofolate cyclodeaminase [Balneicella halophila]|uniref:Formimidoyltransferase-cyclodeaminase n=1 Tax=Balneicella halophila TaxID=1537566 RepID=A0A7L4US33_BALHA|nr:glutamate formimidoyltransferase [Balneicella halophila]PVX52469.1 glutamate formiminotransferase/formiminotetrahydrofolate cyclodeaminase [Balneicella halophila]
MKKIIECVPNFSEGNDMQVIKQITDVIEAVDGVSLLDVDPGKATNRTVVTFVGTPDEVVEAAFQAIKKSSELIDMSKHKGEHPRFGATDVCPFIPVANISMEETVEYARKLAKKVGDELGLAVYCYESAALTPERKNLAKVRSGEYEGLAKKLKTDAGKPDFGSDEFNPNFGAVAVGARNFLIAYNVNLNTTSTRRANAIAFDVRERGRVKREGGKLTGKILRDEKGNPINEPGTLKSVKAIGWFIEEYGVAQISMNLTDISVTSIHKAFDEVCDKAQKRGIRVTGSELVGLIPLDAMLEAGRYFLRKQKRSTGVSDAELIKIAVKTMGLDELAPFDPEEKIIEYKMQEDKKRLVDYSVQGFAEETASESPAPGGGSVAAYMGALGASLATMVANLSSHKRGWDDRWEEFSDWAEKGKHYQQALLRAVDEDTDSFNAIMNAFGLPKSTDEEKLARKQAIQEATIYAAEVPLKTMQLCYDSMEVIKAMTEIGNPNSVTDAAVGALAARSGVLAAYLNVQVNLKDVEDIKIVEKMLGEAKKIAEDTVNMEKIILDIAEGKLSE